MYIGIAGNIGAGKTTLTSLLARHYNYIPEYEKIEDNPYLYDFYQDMERWAFHLQIYTLQKKIAQIISIQKSGQNIVQDRTIYEDVFIFSTHLHSTGLLSERDYNIYLSFFHLMDQFIQAPDLIIYLQANVHTLTQHLYYKNPFFRSKSSDQELHMNYLYTLNQRYDTWAQQYKKGKLIVINIDQNYFNQVSTDFEKIIVKIDEYFAIHSQETSKKIF